MKRPIRALLLASTIIISPALAMADATSLAQVGLQLVNSAITSAIPGPLGTILGAVFTGGFSILQSLLAPGIQQQSGSRTREFNSHPKFRFAFGEFPLEGSVVWHHVRGKFYYVAYLLNSIPIEEVNRVVIQEHTDLEIDSLGSNIYDFQATGNDVNPTASKLWNDRDFLLWVGRGDQTQPPQQMLDEINDTTILKSTDSWFGKAVAWVRYSVGATELQAARLSFGKPPPLRFYGKWSKLYDPRKDPTSGVTQTGTIVVSMALTAPPSGSPSPADGDKYIVAATATGAWAGQENNIATWNDVASPTGWSFAAPTSGQQVWNLDDNAQYTWGGASWAVGQAGHDRDDSATWEWSANPALAALTLVRHQYALAFDDEIIAIQQFADAADAAQADGGTTVTATATIDPITNAGTTSAAAVANGVTISGFTPGQLVKLTLPSGQPFGSWSPWGVPALSGSNTGTQHRFRVAPDGDINNEITITSGIYDGYEAARAAFGSRFITGGSSYTLYIVDDPIGDNTGSMQVSASASPVFGCNGIVEINSRELELLDPVLDCMAGHLDTTEGLIGIRAGVWVAPTDTLSEPVGDDIAMDGAVDAGFDMVRGKFINADLDWTEGDGPGYALRAGFRVHPLELPLVSNIVQVSRLEKIAALRAEPNRIFNATWDAREANRRVGERVNFSLTGSARTSSTYVIDSKSISVEEVDDENGTGLAVKVNMKLIEDVAATYDAPDYSPPDAFVPPTVAEPGMDPPSTVLIEQSNYRDGGSAAARLKVTVTLTQAVADVAQRIAIEVTDGGGYVDFALLDVDEATLSYSTFSATFAPASVGLTYTARARTESDSNGSSEWVVGNSVTIVAPVLDFDPADFSAEYA